MMTLGTYHRSKTKEKGRENQEVRQGMQRNKKAGGIRTNSVKNEMQPSFSHTVGDARMPRSTEVTLASPREKRN